MAGARTIDALTGLDRVTAVAVDLVAPEGPARLIRRALDDHGKVDVLVNNVGAVRMRLQGFLGTSDDDFDWARRCSRSSPPLGSASPAPPMPLLPPVTTATLP